MIIDSVASSVLSYSRLLETLVRSKCVFSQFQHCNGYKLHNCNNIMISWYHVKVKLEILWRFSSALIWDLVRDNFRNSKLRFGKDGKFPSCIIFSLNLKPILKQLLSLAWSRERISKVVTRKTVRKYLVMLYLPSSV